MSVTCDIVTYVLFSYQPDGVEAVAAFLKGESSSDIDKGGGEGGGGVKVSTVNGEVAGEVNQAEV